MENLGFQRRVGCVSALKFHLEKLGCWETAKNRLRFYLLNVFTSQEAMNFILSCLEDGKIQSQGENPNIDAHYEAACNKLARKAVQRGLGDNVSDGGAEQRGQTELCRARSGSWY